MRGRLPCPIAGCRRGGIHRWPTRRTLWQSVAVQGDVEFFKTLVTIVLAAFAFSLAGGLIRMPSIVAYLAAGAALVALGGAGSQSHSIELIAEVGIALMLFLVGLEMSIAKIRDIGAVALVAGIGQVVITAAGGYAICWMLGFAPLESLFLAVALTFSSTVVVVKLLDQKKEIDTLYGRIAIGIFLVQDMVVIIILTLLAGLGQAVETDLPAILRSTGAAFAGMAVLLLAILSASRFVLPRLFALASRSPQTLVIWSLAWCFVCVLGAKALGLSLEIGAFLAGVGLAQLDYNKDLHRRVHPLMIFLLAVFFVSLGMKADFSDVGDSLLAAAILSLFVLIGNPVIFILIIRTMGYRMQTAFLSGVTVAQISEFSFVFVAMGLAAGMIGEQVLSITTLVGFVTISASAYMIIHNHRLFAFFERIGALKWLDFGARRAVDPSDSEPPALRDHVIVVGMNTLGRRIVGALAARGETVLAIDTDPGKLAGLPGRALLGNVEYPGTLEEASIAQAKLVVSALQIEDTNETLAYRSQLCGVPSSILAVDMNHMDDLLDMGVDYLMIPRIDGIKMQNRKLRELGVLAK